MWNKLAGLMFEFVQNSKKVSDFEDGCGFEMWERGIVKVCASHHNHKNDTTFEVNIGNVEVLYISEQASFGGWDYFGVWVFGKKVHEIENL